MTHTQVAWAWAAIVAGIVWTAFWAWIWWMAFRLLRWAYVDRRDARRAGRPVRYYPKAPAPPMRPDAELVNGRWQ